MQFAELRAEPEIPGWRSFELPVRPPKLAVP